MKIREYIEKILDHSSDDYNGRKLERVTDRDRVLWGDPEQECTGIASVIYASIDVIEKAHERGVNLIVCHEALFWNHGDQTEWLKDNTAFIKKVRMLDEYGICVYRYHDHIHAGIELDGTYRDGIFHGLTSLMGWNGCIVNKDDVMPREVKIPAVRAADLAEKITEVFGLNGVRLIGSPDTLIEKVYLPLHINGRPTDSEIIKKVNDEDINCLLTMELVDFTVSEYIHDAAMANEDKCIIALGHFNFEQIGMKYYAGYIKEYLKPDVPVYYIPAGDYYGYVPRRKGD